MRYLEKGVSEGSKQIESRKGTLTQTDLKAS